MGQIYWLAQAGQMKFISVHFKVPRLMSAAEWREMINFAFSVALVSYLGFYLIENLKSGFITAYFNLDYLLWAAIAAGVLSAVWPAVKIPVDEHRKIGWKSICWMIILAAGAATYVWYQTRSIGKLGLIIAPLTGLIVLCLSYLVYAETDEEGEE
jgi:peptidoglycan/LPS O-acetylase OafA/YrhL